MCSCLGSLCSISADDFGPAYQKWENHPARRDWEPLEDLGSGAFSQVVLARHRSTGALAALKVVFLNNPELDVETKIMLMQEGRLLEKLSHPNLVSCSGVVRSPQAHVIILELLRGCNVLDGLFRRRHKYTERDAAGIFTQIASAVAYLHYHGIIHRDIKPENIVYKEMPTWGDTENSFGPGNAPNKVSNSEETPFVKLVDLGMAWQCRPDAVERGVLGSAGFVAPEIVQGCEHSPSMDIFALGVLLFIMLVGRKPFNINESENLKYVRMQLSDAPGLKDPRWLDLSPDAKSLIMGMLAYDPKRRLTAEQVLAHEWVASGGGRTTRKLGADVAMGAATVAEIRRLRFLCSGAVALQRAAGATAQSKSSKKGRRAEGPAGTAEAPPGQPTTEHIAYLEGLRKQRKREASVRGGGGGPSLRGLARTIAAKSYKNVHDGGGSVHRHVFSSSVRGTRSLDPSASGRGTPPRGMRKSGTALLLGELLQATDASISGSEPSYKAGMKRAQTVGQLAPLGSAPSGLQLFAASVRQYVEVSVHGGKGRSPSRGGSSTGGNLSGMGADVSGSGSGRRAESVDRTVRGGSVHGRAAIDRELLKVYQVKRGSLDGNSSVSARSVRSTDSGSAWVKPAGQEGTPKRKVLALAPL